MMLAQKRHHAFTLLELLVVLAIIAVLLSVLAPVLGRMRSEARSVLCLAHLKQIAEAFHLYADANDGYLPSDWTDDAWDAMLQSHLGESAGVFVCPEDAGDFAGAVGLRYAWREWFEVDTDSASLSGSQLASVQASDLVLVFDDLPNRHARGGLNAAALDTSSRFYPLNEFEMNLALAVR